MAEHERILAAQHRLESCEKTVTRLHKMCCEPDRSPRMQAILRGLESAREQIDSAARGPDTSVDLAEVLERLEAIGAQIGSLQVACCAPARMPLYAEVLVALTETQRHLSHHDH